MKKTINLAQLVNLLPVLRLEFGISSRLKVKAFIDDIKNGKSSPLKNITSNYHYHTVEADSEKTLDLIEKTLEEKGYLITEV